MQKQNVRRLFDSIAYRYDLLNHLLSGGIDFYWRRAAIETLASQKPRYILDVATGTGDFAIAALRLNPIEVTGVDISISMLELGKRKIAARNLGGIIRLEAGEAEHLQFSDNRFDAAIVAFGARNFESLEGGLTEMRRVLKQGGKILVLEFSKPKSYLFRPFYFFYFHNILPFVGRMISNDKEAYRYLPDSVMGFPDGDDFMNILMKVGFSSITQQPLTFGIATVYCGEK
ncbi:MAG: bifunctional demethylmenaquinone methyltransferase/2-methoxy-6-polyprenyl-1,4-benzoquinol methylase UbiE [Bacteroidota bacterium]